MTLVDVANRRGQPRLVQGARAADAKDDLLLEPHLVASAVEPARDLAVRGVVLRDVRVEKQQRNSAHPRDAYEEADRASREIDADDRGAAVRRLGRGDRQL